MKGKKKWLMAIIAAATAVVAVLRPDLLPVAEVLGEVAAEAASAHPLDALGDQVEASRSSVS